MQTEGIHALVQRAKLGDNNAWDEIVARANPGLQAYTRQIAPAGGLGQSFESLTQEVWIRAWQKMAMFKGGETDDAVARVFFAWLKQIAFRLHLNAVRPNRRKPPAPLVSLRAGNAGGSCTGIAADALPGPDPTPSKEIDARNRTALIQETLAALPELQQTIVKLRIFEGWKWTQIAKHMTLNESTVRYHFHEAVKTLGPKLKGLL